MDLRVSNWAAATAVSLVLAALAGCSGAEPDNAPPPPPPPPEKPPPLDPPELRVMSHGLHVGPWRTGSVVQL